MIGAGGIGVVVFLVAGVGARTFRRGAESGVFVREIGLGVFVVAHGCRRTCFFTPYRGWFGRDRIVACGGRWYPMRYTDKTRRRRGEGEVRENFVGKVRRT